MIDVRFLVMLVRQQLGRSAAIVQAVLFEP